MDQVARAEVISRKATLKAARALDRQEKRRRSRRLWNQYLHVQSGKFRRALSVEAIKDLAAHARSSRTSLASSAILVFNSTGIFILSYLVAYGLYQLSTAFSGLIFGYPSTWYFHQVYFEIGQAEWYADSVKTIYSSGPLLCLLIAAIARIMFNSRKEQKGLFRLFLMWLFLQCLTISLGGILTGVILNQGFGYVLSWMYASEVSRLFLAVISLAVMGIAGFYSARAFLLTANTYHSHLSRKNIFTFSWTQVILPFLAGSLVLFLARLPQVMLFETITGMLMVIALVPLITGLWSFDEIYFDEGSGRISVSWLWILMSLIILVLYRIALMPGLRIG